MDDNAPPSFAELRGKLPDTGQLASPFEFTEDQLQADPILHYFHYDHLPEKLQSISKPFCHLAYDMIHMLQRNAERSALLRKLLEAKDCAVRANIGHVTKPAFIHPDDKPTDEPVVTGEFDDRPLDFKG